MTESIVKNKLNILPEKPGVYQFYSNNSELLYVGKAKNLKKRVGSYFNKTNTSQKVKVLVSKIADIKYIVVDTESDALLLENNLIKKNQPRYNILLKDDKTYPWICIKNEKFPRVISTRKFINDGSRYYGPYTSGILVKTLLDLIKKLYTTRTCNLNLEPKSIALNKYKACLEFQIGNCKAPCIGNQTEEEYTCNIEGVHSILKGNLNSVRNWLRDSMNKAATNYNFEEALTYKTKIELLDKFQSKTTIVSNKLTNIDVFTFLEKNTISAINYIKVVNGAIIQSYTIQLKKSLDESKEELLGIAITEIRDRVKSNASRVIVPYQPDFLIEGVKYIVPKRGDLKQLLDLSSRNTLTYIHEIEKNIELRNPSASSKRVLETLQKDFRVDILPMHIECFDNSNLQGTDAVSSCVVFRNAKPSKKEYRHYNVKTIVGANDYATMEEVIFRRYQRLIEENQGLPQLIVIDGGKGQLNAAQKSICRLGIENEVKLIGIAKRLEEIYFVGESIPIYLNKNSTSLKVVQNIRNEAHRFGIKHHKNKRSISSLKSELDQIKGIGEKTKERLFLHYKSIDNIASAEMNEMIHLIGKSKTVAVLNHFKKNIE